MCVVAMNLCGMPLQKSSLRSTEAQSEGWSSSGCWRSPVSSCNRPPVTWRNTSSRVGVRRVSSWMATPRWSRANATALISAAPLPTLTVSSLPCTSTLFTRPVLLSASTAASTSPSTLAMMRSEPRARFSSWGVPWTASLPRLMMPIRWARASASSRYWVVRKMVTPSLLVYVSHLLPDAGAADRIQAGGRLVQEEDLRVVYQGCGQVKAAFHTARVSAYQPVHSFADVHQVREVGDAAVYLPPRQAVKLALKPQQLSPRLLVVQGGVLESRAYPQPHLDWLAHGVVPGHGYAAGRGRQKRDQNPYDGCLPRAVGAKEPENLPFADGHVHAVHGLHDAKMAHKPFHGNGVCVFRRVCHSDARVERALGFRFAVSRTSGRSALPPRLSWRGRPR